MSVRTERRVRRWLPVALVAYWALVLLDSGIAIGVDAERERWRDCIDAGCAEHEIVDYLTPEDTRGD